MVGGVGLVGRCSWLLAGDFFDWVVALRSSVKRIRGKIYVCQNLPVRLTSFTYSSPCI